MVCCGGRFWATAMKQYYFAGLAPEEQNAYRRLAQGLAQHRPQIEAGALAGGAGAAVRVMDAVLRDNPQLCFCGITGAGLLLSPQGISFHPKWLYTPEETQQLQTDLKAAANKILAPLLACKGDYEKEKRLHDYFVRTLRYQDCAREGSIGHHEAHTIIGPLLRHTGVCEGYAKAMTLLLRRAGVAAICVRGKAALDGVQEPHSWNCVWVDGAPCHLDVTWDNTVAQQGGAVRYDYLNLTDAEISLDHFDYEAPACTQQQHGYFRREGLEVQGKESLRALLKQAVLSGASALTFKVLPGKTGYPANLEAVVKNAVELAGIRRCSISVNPGQHVVMLAGMTN